MNIDQMTRSELVKLEAAVVMQMLRDYKYISNELEYLQLNQTYQTRGTGLSEEGLRALSPVRRRAVEKILGTKIKNPSISWHAKFLNKKPEIYRAELEAEMAEMEGLFFSEIFTGLFPEFDSERCRRKFVEYSKHYELSQNKRGRPRKC